MTKHLASLFITGLLMAQEPAPAPAAPAGGGGGAGGGVTSPNPGAGNTTSPFPGRTNPTQNPNDRMQFPEMGPRPIFISGKVLMDDGTPPTEQVVIERVCGSTPKPEGYTDSKGNFSFELGRNQAMNADASYSGAGDDGFGSLGGRGTSSGNSRAMPGGGTQINERDLMGCELRASLPGYRSDVISLAGRRTLDNPNVGTIILHRRAGVEGYTTSGTSLMAPKDAKKAYDKATKLAKSKKPAEAQKELESAVSLYPKYAAAWYELGLIHERENRGPEAAQAYAKSMEADGKFIKPYLQMAGIYAKENKWKEVQETTDRAIKLNPYDFPAAYFYNSVAAINLRDLEAAEKSAREGIKLDSQNRIPKLTHVLGVVLAQKQDFSGAAENMKLYLKLVPNAPDADNVRKQLAEVEGNLAQVNGPKAAQQ
jgi:tetratricopeptide (TPR) repeat protein